MTGEQIENYIINELDSEPRHDVYALADAINDVAEEIEHDSFDLMRLLLENVAIDSLYTHSHGFHTANGRHLINKLQYKYYEYKSTS